MAKKKPTEVTPELLTEMKRFYAERTKKHIRTVQGWGTKINEEFNERFDMTSHDLSKYSPIELEPYIYLTWRYRCPSEGDEQFIVTDEMEARILAACTHHVQNNRHHPEYWDDKYNGEDNGIVDGTKMPKDAIAEMCADWMAMSTELGGCPLEWFKLCNYTGTNNPEKTQHTFTHEQQVLITKYLSIYHKYTRTEG